MTRDNMTSVVEALGDIRRFQAVKKISVIREVVSEELFQAVARQQGLRSLIMANCDLSAVEPELLVRAVTRLEEVNMTSMTRTQLTEQQADAVLTAVCGGASRLKTLDMFGTNLSLVNASLLAKAVISLEQVNLSNTKLTQQQTKEILTAVCANGSLLKTLDISWNKLSSVEEGLLARAVKSLEEVKLGRANLSRQQAEAVFVATSERDSQLKNLSMQDNNLSFVDPNILARAVTSLKEVNLPSNHLTERQLEAIFTAITAGHSQLNNLNIQNNYLSSAEPALLARAVTSLENVILFCTQLTKQQLEAIFTTICFGASRLKTLDLTSNRLYSVEKGLLARAVNSLVEVNLSYISLSRQKAEEILTQSLVKTSLRRLKMDCQGLDDDLVARARLAIGSLGRV